MKSEELARLFAEYASYHRHPTNKLFHYVGIPMIVFTTLGLLWRASPGVAVVVGLGVVLYDLRLSVRLTVPFAVFVLLSGVVAPSVSTKLLWTGFVLGWALQFAGHIFYEKKAPAFFENMRQLLVAPLWIIGTLVERREDPLAAPGTGRPAE